LQPPLCCLLLRKNSNLKIASKKGVIIKQSYDLGMRHFAQTSSKSVLSLN